MASTNQTRSNTSYWILIGSVFAVVIIVCFFIIRSSSYEASGLSENKIQSEIDGSSLESENKSQTEKKGSSDEYDIDAELQRQYEEFQKQKNNSSKVTGNSSEVASNSNEGKRVSNEEQAFEFYHQAFVSFAMDGNINLAIQNLNKAIKLNPEYGEAYARRSYLLISQQKLKEAYRDAKRSISLLPHHNEANAYYSLAISEYFLYGKTDEACADMDHALKVSEVPGQDRVDYQLAQKFIQKFCQ